MQTCVPWNGAMLPDPMASGSGAGEDHRQSTALLGHQQYGVYLLSITYRQSMKCKASSTLIIPLLEAAS